MQALKRRQDYEVIKHGIVDARKLLIIFLVKGLNDFVDDPPILNDGISPPLFANPSSLTGCQDLRNA